MLRARIVPLDFWTKRTNKTEVLDMKRDIIEQNKHLLSNMETWECHQMKIIKGKWFILMLFLTFVTLSLAGKWLYGFLWLGADLT